MKLKVAIIGGSGFIGTRLCDRLSKRNDIDFAIFDKQDSKKYPAKWQWCDIREIDSLRKVLPGYDLVVNLAAEHKDNVQPVSKYYDVNVEGQKNVCAVLDELDIKRHVFTSSVSVYGFVDNDTDESGSFAPFHEYGDSKLKAEEVLNAWHNQGKQHSVIRPTVVFGEGNRGNVYNLLRQIACGKFLMIGDGENKKSMAYVENVAAFIEHLIFNGQEHQVFNYVDKPDLTMNELCDVVYQALGKKGSSIRAPYWLGLMGGYTFDVLSKLTGKEFPVSSIRIKKFCATTQFSSSSITDTDYSAPVSLDMAIAKTIKSEFMQ